MPFDLLVRGGTLVDGTGAPGRPADVGVTGGRILAVGDLSAVDPAGVATVIDATGHVVAPGFIDPHGHSDASVLLDGALVSHLRQGFTTQLSGNCGDTLAPLTPLGRPLLGPFLAEHGLEPGWTTFAGYLDAVEAVPLGVNLAFLVGQGTIRGAVLGATDRRPDTAELRAMQREVELAMDAGAIGLSSGLIYAPGMHAAPDEVAALVATAARRGGLYATHMRNETDDLFDAIDEAISAIRAAGEGARLQVSHLKAASRAVHGRGAEAVAVLERARASGLDVAADQYPYVAAATTLATILPPAILALDPPAAAALLRTPSARRDVRDAIERGLAGWENVAADPGWGGIAIAWAPSRPDWAGRTLAELGRDLAADPLDLALDALAADDLAVDCVIVCMTEADVEAIMAVPWIAVCTDAEGRRPGHPILGHGVPHPRTYGSAPRVLGRYVRERGVLSLETAVAKLTSVPAKRLGLRDRGVVRAGAAADLVVLDPATVADVATFERPAQHPAGIPHVIVNGVPAILDGAETGARPGRLLRRG